MNYAIFRMARISLQLNTFQKTQIGTRGCTIAVFEFKVDHFNRQKFEPVCIIFELHALHQSRYMRIYYGMNVFFWFGKVFARNRRVSFDGREKNIKTNRNSFKNPSFIYVLLVGVGSWRRRENWPNKRLDCVIKVCCHHYSVPCAQSPISDV